jgi:hypothetical protein
MDFLVKITRIDTLMPENLFWKPKVARRRYVK